ncbi:MAG: aminomethyl-transferring glycine dehydrogenase subunit GcvPB [Chloroflexota bacterium]|nr:aminomethyl-transferring glycine dehydrogenase subunit GcvPB [Chloroflexota bacterium]MDQ5866474.1 aminomethyl-transferring glycine dehydrogenase subunit GcvPB [Chloroflexota bacterium]
MSVEPLIFELSSPGRIGFSLPPVDMDEAPEIDASLLREELDMPEVSEVDVTRHFVRLSQKNYGIDIGFYPLGSCTMKYNPKVHEDVAILPGFAAIHPYQDPGCAQGALQVMYELQGMLGQIVGMDAVTLQPAAGAHGEFTGILMIRAYHRSRGESQRDTLLVPDSAHGTNPATAAAAGFKLISLKSGADGSVDLDALRGVLSDRIAGMMLTVPSTLGLFEPNILEISRLVHEAGGLMYGDGANLNALVGHIRPGDLGFDVMHINLHKTFTTPHGGGGPGSGPVACKSHLAQFLPGPLVGKGEDGYAFVEPDASVGRVKNFWGNFGMHVRAYTYIRHLGLPGLQRVSEDAILNANYIRANLTGTYHLPYNRICMHEVVLSGKNIKQETGCRTLDIAKRLIDHGMHPPTVYFPLIVEEALMIEPTETESKETLDQFIAAMKAVAAEARTNPDILHAAPVTTEYGRLDEVTAAREPNLRWRRPLPVAAEDLEYVEQAG